MNSAQLSVDGLEEIFIKSGFNDFKWIDPQNIIVAQWVRMKCMFGCSNYGQGACCPPNLPSVPECERFFREYEKAVIFHFEQQMENPDDRHAWSREINLKLMDVERAVFLAGYEKTFLLFMDSCQICEECVGNKVDCKHPKQARPAPEGMAVDVFKTARHAGYHIEVLKDYLEPMNRYAILLVK